MLTRQEASSNFLPTEHVHNHCLGRIVCHTFSLCLAPVYASPLITVAPSETIPVSTEFCGRLIIEDGSLQCSINMVRAFAFFSPFSWLWLFTLPHEDQDFPVTLASIQLVPDGSPVMVLSLPLTVTNPPPFCFFSSPLFLGLPGSFLRCFPLPLRLELSCLLFARYLVRLTLGFQRSSIFCSLFCISCSLFCGLSFHGFASSLGPQARILLGSSALSLR